MEAHEYATLFAFETDYWWYRTLHGVLLDTLDALRLPDGPRILDAGCGTGGLLLRLQHGLSPQACGFDYAAQAASFWPARGVRRGVLASINELPYADASFDAVVSVDVLESDGVDERKALSELLRVTRPGGCVLVTVPAFTWMMTEEHHRAVHASRRYTRASALALWEGLPAQIVRATYLFALIFPAVAAYRLALRLRPPVQGPPRSELKPIAGPVNHLLTAYNALERRLLRQADMPVGSSILMVARKR